MAAISGGAGYILGKGFVAEGDGNGSQRWVGEVDDFNTNVEFEELEIYANSTAVKTLDKTFRFQTNPGFSYVMKESAIPANMALGLSGNVTDVAQTGATDEAIASGLTTQKGCFIDLGKRKITSITFTTPASPTEGTDYVLYGDQGLLLIPYASTIADDTEIAGTITYSTVNYKKISVFSQNNVEKELWFMSALSPYPKLKLWRTTQKVAGDLNWISDEPLLIPIEGKILDDTANHPSPNHFGELTMEDITA